LARGVSFEGVGGQWVPSPWPFSSSWLRHAHRIREPETLRRRARFTIFGLWRHGADSRGFKILQVVDLTGTDIMAQVSAGTWFVDFYAPQYAPQLAGLFFSCCPIAPCQCWSGSCFGPGQPVDSATAQMPTLPGVGATVGATRHPATGQQGRRRPLASGA
jgi:hypothetical protein